LFYRRSRLVAAALALAVAADAQDREVQRHELESPEGRLLGYYSAALAVTPLGVPFRNGALTWTSEFGFELAYIPYLTRQQRSAGFDKPEASNLSPLLPRPHISLVIPAQLVLQGSWLPPVKVMGAEANLFSVSLRRALLVGGMAIAPRISYMSGRVKAPITCSDDLGAGEADERIYYANICHARESEDYFDPTHFSFDVTFTELPQLAGATSYVAVGVRRESSSFDIGVIGNDGLRDPDHPVLEMVATRSYAVAGLQWDPNKRRRYGFEIFFSPGSLVTVRAHGALWLR